MKSALSLVALALLAPLAALAAPIPWTMTAAGCTPVPGAPATVANGGGVTYASISTSVISLAYVCNVAATGNTAAPEYTTLTVGYSNVAAAGQVQAELVAINPASGAVETHSCIARNAARPGGGTASCALGHFTFDFTHNYYQVLLTVSRSAQTQFPQANGVSLH